MTLLDHWSFVTKAHPQGDPNAGHLWVARIDEDRDDDHTWRTAEVVNTESGKTYVVPIVSRCISRKAVTLWINLGMPRHTVHKFTFEELRDMKVDGLRSAIAGVPA